MKPDTAEIEHGVLVPRKHTAFDGIPYHDPVLDVPQSDAHAGMVGETTAILMSIAREAGLDFLTDQPIWYLHPETLEQRVYYGDWVFARPGRVERITADDLLLVIEVVSTNDKRKEVKDSRFSRLLNEVNNVPEFGLVFPDADDARAVSWCRLEDERYQQHDVAPGGRVVSKTVEGLELRILPRDEWEDGYKFHLYYRGEYRGRIDDERARAAQEKARAEQEKARAEQEKARAERLAAKLRELGVDPDDL